MNAPVVQLVTTEHIEVLDASGTALVVGGPGVVSALREFFRSEGARDDS